MGVLKQTFNSLHVTINMAGPSKESSKIKKKSKTALLLDDDEKAEKAADKEAKRQDNIVRNAKLEQILARKLNPNAVSPETTGEIPKEVAEKLKIKALKEEQAKQEAEQIELAKKEDEIANLARMNNIAAEKERKMIEWAEQKHFRKLVEEKLGNRSFLEKYLVYGVTKVCLLGIVIVLGSVLGMLIVRHQEACVNCGGLYRIKQKVLLFLILCWSLGSIALIRHSYYKFKEFMDNNEQKQKDHCEQEIRNANPVV